MRASGLTLVAGLAAFAPCAEAARDVVILGMKAAADF